MSVGEGVANVPGHLTVSCTHCHDLLATGCAACHKASHKKRGACDLCHKAGPKWVFTHTAETECERCHENPAKHLKLAGRDLAPCADCHLQTGVSWAFTHPDATHDCADCHALPSKHYRPLTGKALPACTDCHRQAGKSWAFVHPDVAAICQNCHVVPARHPAGACISCHATWTSFSFVHPATGAPHDWKHVSCSACHPHADTRSFKSVVCSCHSRRPNDNRQ